MQHTPGERSTAPREDQPEEEKTFITHSLKMVGARLQERWITRQGTVNPRSVMDLGAKSWRVSMPLSSFLARVWNQDGAYERGRHIRCKVIKRRFHIAVDRLTFYTSPLWKLGFNLTFMRKTCSISIWPCQLFMGKVKLGCLLFHGQWYVLYPVEGAGVRFHGAS